MIYKFQQGGKQQEALMQFVQGLAQTLQADPQQVVQIAQQNPDALEAAVQVYQQTQDMGQAAQIFQQAIQKKTQAAKHGAKLNYIKSLKNQCAEDEELVYYKKGGSVDCGCVKKNKEGNKVEKKESDWKTKFRTRKASSGMAAPAEKKTVASYQKKNKVNPSDTVHVDGKAYSLTSMNGEKVAKQFPSYVGSKAHKKDEASAKKGNKDAQRRLNKQDEITAPKNGAKMKLVKKGDKVCPKCGKVHSARIGCSVAGFKKKFQQGGNIFFNKKG